MQLEQRSMPYSNVQQSMVQELHKCSETWRKARRIQNFSKWPRGTGKSHVVCLIQRDMFHFFKCTVKPNDDQPIVLIMLYNVLLINQYIGNITIKWYNKSRSDNRDPTVVLHQEIYTLPVSVASDTRCF